MEDLLKNTDKLELKHQDADLKMYINIDGLILIRITDICSMTVYRGYEEEEEYEIGDAGIALTKEMAIQLRDKLNVFIDRVAPAEPTQIAQTDLLHIPDVSNTLLCPFCGGELYDSILHNVPTCKDCGAQQSNDC